MQSNHWACGGSIEGVGPQGLFPRAWGRGWAESPEVLCSAANFQRMPFPHLGPLSISCLPWELILTANYMAGREAGERGGWGVNLSRTH